MNNEVMFYLEKAISTLQIFSRLMALFLCPKWFFTLIYLILGFTDALRF